MRCVGAGRSQRGWHTCTADRLLSSTATSSLTTCFCAVRLPSSSPSAGRGLSIPSAAGCTAAAAGCWWSHQQICLEGKLHSHPLLNGKARNWAATQSYRGLVRQRSRTAGFSSATAVSRMQGAGGKSCHAAGCACGRSLLPIKLPDLQCPKLRPTKITFSVEAFHPRKQGNL